MIACGDAPEYRATRRAPPANRKELVPLPDPRLVERRVLHALATRHEVAVDDVNGAVPALNDGRVVIAAALVPLQVSRRLPRPPLVRRQGDGQAVPAALCVVVLGRAPRDGSLLAA